MQVAIDGRLQVEGHKLQVACVAAAFLTQWV
jgi:hypothetical protein